VQFIFNLPLAQPAIKDYLLHVGVASPLRPVQYLKTILFCPLAPVAPHKIR